MTRILPTHYGDKVANRANADHLITRGKPMLDPSWENTFQTRVKIPRSDFNREVEALLVSLGLKSRTKDLVLKVRFGDKVELIQ